MNDSTIGKNAAGNYSRALASGLQIPVLFIEVAGIVRVTCEASEAAAFYAAREAEFAALLARESIDQLLDDPRLAGYRALHQSLGLGGRRYRPSPETLFRLLFNRGRLDPAGLLVDVYTRVALATRTSIGAHDLDRLALPLTLAMSTNGETFTAIGATAPEPLRAGEYVYRDAADRIAGRLEIRQAEFSRVTAATNDVVFILQGNPAVAIDSLDDTADQLLADLDRYCGGYTAARRFPLT